MSDANEMKILSRIEGRIKINRIRSQDIREPCGIQPINRSTERRRREQEKHITRMEAERLGEISRDHQPAGR